MKKFSLLIASALAASSLMAAAPVSSPSANKFGFTMGFNVGGGIVYDTPKYQYTLTTGSWNFGVNSNIDTYNFRASASMKTPMTSSIDQLWTVQGFTKTSTNYGRASIENTPYTFELQYGFQQAISKKLTSYIRMPILSYEATKAEPVVRTISLLDHSNTVIGISMYR
tara:strand:+ start:1392 stop:1895 length:504 start_codon:yes stop_codon:yes gene_type:complete